MYIIYIVILILSYIISCLTVNNSLVQNQSCRCLVTHCKENDEINRNGDDDKR